MVPPDDNIGQLFNEFYVKLNEIAERLVRLDHRSETESNDLVHECYLRFYRSKDTTRENFLERAAIAIRRVLVDSARKRSSVRKGGDVQFSAELPEITYEQPFYEEYFDVNLGVERALAEFRAVSPGMPKFLSCA
jgi:DNA-directed RNA polymerase specialized sigma24 family protein